MKRFLVIPLVVIIITALILALSGCSQPSASSPVTTSKAVPIQTAPSQSTPPQVAKTSPAASAAASPTPTPKYGGILKVNLNRGATILGYPPEMGGSGVIDSAYPALESIAGRDSSGAFVPTKLSTALTVAPDGKSMTLTLRKGVKFHDGTDWNAQAAKWNLDKIMGSKNISGTANWKSVDVVDDYTIRINESQYSITDVSTLCWFGGFMVSPTAVEKNGLDWARVNPVGTGPFKFVSFSRDVLIKYQRFDNYWDGKPYLDEIDFPMVIDPSTQSMSFQAGDLDVLNPSGVYAAQLIDKGYKYVQTSAIMYLMVPDSANPDSPFANQKVREAVEYAIDKTSIAKAVGYKQWDNLDQPAPKGNSGFDPNLTPRAYNPQKAKDLLAQAGYPNGFQTQIIGDSQRMSKDALVAIQQNLKDVGIQADLNILQLAAWTDKDTKGWKNGLLAFICPASEPFAATLQQFYVSNSTHWFSALRPAGFDDAVIKALAALDFNSAKKLTLDAANLWQQNEMSVPCWVTASTRVFQSYVYDTAFYTSGGVSDWAPAKAWINK